MTKIKVGSLVVERYSVFDSNKNRVLKVISISNYPSRVIYHVTKRYGKEEFEYHSPELKLWKGKKA